jgi:hypothetical protein
MSSHTRARVRAATIASHVAPSSPSSLPSHQLTLRPTNVVVAGEPTPKIKQKKNYDLENAEVYVFYHSNYFTIIIACMHHTKEYYNLLLVEIHHSRYFYTTYRIITLIFYW